MLSICTDEERQFQVGHGQALAVAQLAIYWIDADIHVQDSVTPGMQPVYRAPTACIDRIREIGPKSICRERQLLAAMESFP